MNTAATSARQAGRRWPVLAVLLFGAGCFATGAQVYLVREMLVLFAGNELCLGIIYTFWFAGIVWGAALGGRLARRLGASKPAASSAAVALVLACLGAVLLVRNWRALAGLAAGELPGLGELSLAALVAVLPVGFFVGLFFPLACRLLGEENDDRAIGRAYLAEALGATAGGIVSCLVLAGRVPTLPALWLLALPLLATLPLLPRPSRHQWWRRGLLLLLAGTGLWLAYRLDESSTRRRFAQLQTGLERVDGADTPYQYLDLGRSGNQYTLLADGKVTATFPDAYRARLRAHLVLCQHPRPGRVLLIGQAPFDLLPVMLTHPLQLLQVVVLDRRLIELVRPHLDARTSQALDDPRVRLLSDDGRRFLQRQHQQWDVIFTDVADPTTAAQNRFYTREFFSLARKRLAPGGVLVTRLSAGPNYLSRQTAGWLGTVSAALEEVFDKVVLIAGQETFLAASDDAGAPLADARALGRRYSNSGATDRDFTPYHFSALVQEDLADDFLQQIRVRGRRQANSDSRPVTYLLGLLRWTRLTGSRAGGLLEHLSTWPAWAWLLLCPLLVVAWWLLVLLGGRGRDAGRAALAAAVFAAGAAGMAAELIILYAYQAHLGSLYREVGLVLAAFMAGLSAGSQSANRRIAAGGGSITVFRLALGVLAGTCAALALVLAGVGADWPLWLVRIVLLLAMFSVAAAVGFMFPLAGHLAVARGRPLSLAAGSLDAHDHLGGLSGALLGGLLLLPAAGQSLAFLALAAMVLAAALIALRVRLSPD